MIRGQDLSAIVPDLIAELNQFVLPRRIEQAHLEIDWRLNSLSEYVEIQHLTALCLNRIPVPFVTGDELATDFARVRNQLS